MAGIKIVAQLLSILCVLSHSRGKTSRDSDDGYYSIIADLIDQVIDGDDECPITCPCFTSRDIIDACMGSECSYTDTFSVQEITCDDNAFKITPFNNQCIGPQTGPIYANDDEFEKCSSLIVMDSAVMKSAVMNCAKNEEDICPSDQSIIRRKIEDPEMEFDTGDLSRPQSVTSTINIAIDPTKVEGLILDDIVISVAAEHTRIGDVLAELSHNGNSVRLFGNDISSSSHCGYDDIFVTITDKGSLPAADLRTCNDAEGGDVNGGASLGFTGENGVIGLGGTRRPLQPLNTFISQEVAMDINGEWELTLSDDTKNNIGYFGAWEITFVYINEQVKEMCKSAVASRATCCDNNADNKALCDSTETYCKSNACLISRNNADNLETIIDTMFQAVDLNCFE